MPMKLVSLNVDLVSDFASANLSGELSPGKRGTVNLHVPIKTPGNQTERDLKKIAREAAKDALREALRALEDS